VAGAANNQLATPENGDELNQLGILYAPDFIINAGGLINVADELRGYDRDRAMRQVETVYRNLRAIFGIAREEGISTARAADRFALERIERVGRLRRILVPRS
jgi:leucine dehydrogenase